MALAIVLAALCCRMRNAWIFVGRVCSRYFSIVAYHLSQRISASGAQSPNSTFSLTSLLQLAVPLQSPCRKTPPLPSSLMPITPNAKANCCGTGLHAAVIMPPRYVQSCDPLRFGPATHRRCVSRWAALANLRSRATTPALAVGGVVSAVNCGRSNTYPLWISQSTACNKILCPSTGCSAISSSNVPSCQKRHSSRNHLSSS
mmetsp:Transcript_79809/g.220710  ORF Transcript_79809/g.220710 Transcript_79809/m.220710 type:complete len:202 (-) Transcript_79809:258-863(-)